MAIVTAEIYFSSGDYIDSIVIGACTRTGDITLRQYDRRNLLDGLSIPEILDTIDAIEDYDTGEFISPAMAIVAAYIDAAYDHYEQDTFRPRYIPNRSDLTRVRY
jgi:hypothetical protein